jgi:hypothetical protein
VVAVSGGGVLCLGGGDVLCLGGGGVVTLWWQLWWCVVIRCCWFRWGLFEGVWQWWWWWLAEVVFG